MSSQESLNHCFHLTRLLGPRPLLQRGLDRDEARRWLKAVTAGGAGRSVHPHVGCRVLSRAGGCLAAHHRDLLDLCSWQLGLPLLAGLKPPLPPPPPPPFPGHTPIPAALQQQSSCLKHCGSSAVAGKLGSGQGSVGKTSPEGAVKEDFTQVPRELGKALRSFSMMSSRHMLTSWVLASTSSAVGRRAGGYEKALWTSTWLPASLQDGRVQAAPYSTQTREQGQELSPSPNLTCSFSVRGVVLLLLCLAAF